MRLVYGVVYCIRWRHSLIATLLAFKYLSANGIFSSIQPIRVRGSLVESIEDCVFVAFLDRDDHPLAVTQLHLVRAPQVEAG